MDSDYHAAAQAIQCYQGIGDDEGARDAARRAFARIERLCEIEPEHGSAMGHGAGILAILGERERAREYIARALLLDPDNRNLQQNVVCALVLNGDLEDAINQLARVLQSPTSPQLKWIALDNDLDPLREMPVFKALVSDAETRLGEKRMNAVCLAVISLLAAIAPPASHAAEDFCDRSGSTPTPSPDGQWVANVQEEVCSTSNGAAAGVTVVVSSIRDPTRSKRVFIMTVPRSREDWPRIRWQGPAAMEIRVPNLSEASPPTPEFEGVHITLAYCGDNPEDRERLANYKLAVKQWQKDVSAWASFANRMPRLRARGPRGRKSRNLCPDVA